MSDYKLTANVRHDLGKGASRRLRRVNQQVAAIIYGGEKAPQPIVVDKAAFYKAIEDEAFFSSLIDIDVDGSKEQVIIRDLQRHPFKALVTHADFLRVDATHEMTINVPLHVAGEDANKSIKEKVGVLGARVTQADDRFHLAHANALPVSVMKMPALLGLVFAFLAFFATFGFALVFIVGADDSRASDADDAGIVFFAM